jgi:hypothetical protein
MKRKDIVVIVVFVVLLGNFLLMVHLRKGNTAVLKPHQFFNEAYAEKIASQLEPMRLQSLEESLSMLDRMAPYRFPGIRSDGMFSPDDNGRYKLNMDQQKEVLSSRVFRKCVQEVQLLPKKEATRLIEKHLEKAFSAYINAYESKEPTDLREDKKDGSPVYHGLRNKVFALLLIAGTCELTDTYALVNKVANVASEQKNWSLEIIAGADIPSEYVSIAQNVALTQSTLWNPPILCAGLLGTHPRKNLPEFDVLSKRYIEHSLVDYTAPLTEYDRVPFIPVKPDKEYIKIRYFEGATDDDVLLLLGISNK